MIKAVEEETSIPRYRLGSLYPNEITDDVLDFLIKSKKFCPHFHLSLQSACDKTLKSMNRHYKVNDYLELIEKMQADDAIINIYRDISGLLLIRENVTDRVFQELIKMPLNVCTMI